MTKIVTINEAESHLEELLELVNQGEEILIEKKQPALGKTGCNATHKKTTGFWATQR